MICQVANLIFNFFQNFEVKYHKYQKKTQKSNLLKLKIIKNYIVISKRKNDGENQDENVQGDIEDDQG